MAPKPWGPAAKAVAGRGEQSSTSSPWVAAAAAGPSSGGAGSSSAPTHVATDGPLLRPLTKGDMERGGGGGGSKKSKPVLLFSSGQRRY